MGDKEGSGTLRKESKKNRGGRSRQGLPGRTESGRGVSGPCCPPRPTAPALWAPPVQPPPAMGPSAHWFSPPEGQEWGQLGLQELVP